MSEDTITLALSRAQALALLSTFESAWRGRDDFEYLAGLDRGDYSAEDVARARERHRREVEAEREVIRQFEEQRVK